MQSETKLGAIGVVLIVVAVAGVAAYIMTQDSGEDSDNGFVPNPPVTGDWHYTALLTSNPAHTTFYKGTLHITVEDNDMTLFEKDTVRILASQMSDEELDLALAEIGKHNTGSNGSSAIHWPPETDPVYIISHSFDYASDFTSLSEETDFTDGYRTVECYLFEDDDGVRYWIAESGIIYGVNVAIDNITQFFVMNGWEYE